MPTWVGGIAVDSNGRLWIGSSSVAHWGGLCQLADNGNWVRHALDRPILAIYAFDKLLYLGTNDGVIMFDISTMQVVEELKSLTCGLVTALLVDKVGRLWIGTEGGGLNCYDGEVVQSITIPGGAQHNVINGLSQAEDNSVWIASEGGLVNYRPSSGIPTIQIIEIVAGEIFVDPVKVTASSSAELVGIRFQAHSHADGFEDFLYRYRLEDHEQDWVITDKTYVEYRELEPGEYLFVIEAISRDLNYSERQAIPITIEKDPRLAALHEALGSAVSDGDLIGESQSIARVRLRIRQVSKTNATVLILGETGTGKGLAAKAIHRASERHDGPFVHVNCGALVELIDSELFGHERGAFTGAVARKLGKFELADGGTLFLDEVGDLPVASQARLLHVLQDFSIERLGGQSTIDVDVRVIAATNRDLSKSVRDGCFRNDLYYRLNAFVIDMPPLRERVEDISALVPFFARDFASHLNCDMPYVQQTTMNILMSYDWPGNVRELQHTLQQAVILSEGQAILPEHLSLRIAETNDGFDEPAGVSFLTIRELECRHIRRVLQHTKGVIYGNGGAASILGLHPNTLRSRMAKLKIKKNEHEGV